MSLLLSELAGIPFSVLIVLLNIPFFILGYKQLGLRLAVSSMFAIIVLSFWSHIFEQMEPVTTDPFLSTIFGGIIIGLGIGLVIKNGGSLDGTEIVAIYLDSGIESAREFVLPFVIEMLEHEDSLMSPKEGLEKAVNFLKDKIIAEKAGEMWWV